MKTNKKADRVKFVQLVCKHLGTPKKETEYNKNWIVRTKTSDLSITVEIGESNHKHVYSVYCRYIDSIPKNANNQYSGKHNLHLHPCSAKNAFEQFVVFLNEAINEI